MQGGDDRGAFRGVETDAFPGRGAAGEPFADRRGVLCVGQIERVFERVGAEESTALEALARKVRSQLAAVGLFVVRRG